MTIEKKDHQVFSVTYTRQGKTNQWKSKTKEEPGLKPVGIEGVVTRFVFLREEQKEADANRTKIAVEIERDPRYFDMSPELEEAQMAMLEKVNQMADKDFLKRHPDAEIVHSEQ